MPAYGGVMHRYVSNDLFVILGAVYGALTAALLSSTLSFKAKSTIFFTGAGFAVFVGPAICEYYGIVSPYAVGAMLYIGGAVGNFLLIRVLEKMQKGDIIQTIIEMYRGGRGRDNTP